MGRLVILSGPSCVGKGPLCAALGRLHPELARKLTPVVLYNDRAPRPGERDGVDYHFRPRAEIERLRRRKDFIVTEVRGDLQALDLSALRRTLDLGDAFFEGNPFVACALLELPLASHVETLSAFLSPLSKEEIVRVQGGGCGVSLSEFLTEVMRRKLLGRTVRQKGGVSPEDREDIERRATSAVTELRFAPRFQHVIPNHDGEDSANWDVFGCPVGDARKALGAFVDLLSGRPTGDVEQWREGDPV